MDRQCLATHHHGFPVASESVVNISDGRAQLRFERWLVGEIFPKPLACPVKNLAQQFSVRALGDGRGNTAKHLFEKLERLPTFGCLRIGTTTGFFLSEKQQGRKSQTDYQSGDHSGGGSEGHAVPTN